MPPIEPPIARPDMPARARSICAGVRASEQRIGRGQALQTIRYEDALRDKIVVGSPASVTARLKDLICKLGLNGVLAEINCGGLIANAKVMCSLQLICNEVAPHLR